MDDAYFRKRMAAASNYSEDDFEFIDSFVEISMDRVVVHLNAVELRAMAQVLDERSLLKKLES